MNNRAQNIKKIFQIARVLSDSMYPTIKKNELVLLKRTDDKEIKLGDIVGFKNENNIPIIHRVIRVSSNKIQTAADSNRKLDNPISKGKVIGKVIKIKVNSKWKGIDKFYSYKVVKLFIVFSVKLAIYSPKVKIFSFLKKIFVRVNREIIKNSLS